MPNAVLERLLQQRADQETFIAQLLERVESENRDLVDAELSNLSAARERIAALDEQITPLEEFEATRSAHQQSAPRPVPTWDAPANGGPGQRMTVTDRPTHEYRTAGEFVADYIAARGVEGHLPASPEAQARIAGAEVRTVASQTTGQTPGLFPVNIIGQVLNDIDGSRPFIESFGAKDMHGIAGKKFQRPVVTQHVKTGQQVNELDELTSRQFQITGIDFNKYTFGGALLVSRQDIDWTSPAAWDAIIGDLQFEYGMDTDDFAALNFSTGIAQTVDYTADGTMGPIIASLYKAARVAASANGTKRISSRRLINHVWVSADMWETLGTAIDKVRALSAAPLEAPGEASPMSFAGSILEVERTVVPGLPAGVMVVGNDKAFEFYEERIGLLSQVKPSILGVEVAYGGYGAAGFLDSTQYVKVTGGVPAWAGTTAYGVGAVVRNGSAILEATAGGTTAGSAPANPAVGSTVVDGTVTWVRRA